jgi:hypothetical protein
MQSPPHIAEVYSTHTFTSLSAIVTDEPDQRPQKLPEYGDITTGVHDFAPCDLPEGVPMPVSADPNIPDPTSRSPPTIHVVVTAPEVSTSPYSPADTPGAATPDSAYAEGMTGLFTPSNGISAPGTPRQHEELDGGDVLPEQESSKTPTVALEEPQTQEEVVCLAVDVAADETPVDEAVPDGAIQTTNTDDTIDSGPSMPLPLEVSFTAVPPPSLVPTLHGADPSNPVLYADPYPYSLSTPGSEFLLSTPRMDEGELPSEEENGQSVTSTPTTKNSEESSHVQADRYTHDFGLSYPSDTEQYSLETITPALGDVQDYQAEGMDNIGLGLLVDVDTGGGFEDPNVFVSIERTELDQEEPPEDIFTKPLDFDAAVGESSDMQKGESEALALASEDVEESATDKCVLSTYTLLMF